MTVVAILVFAALVALAILIVAPFAYMAFKIAEVGFLVLKRLHANVGTSKFIKLILGIAVFIAVCYAGLVLWKHIHQDELERERIQIQYEKLVDEQAASISHPSSPFEK